MVRHARQQVVPHLSYEDPFAALAWLCRVFGFTEAKDDFKAWMRERAPHFEEAAGRSWPLLTPWGVRSYSALDPEGHQWELASATNSSPEA
jgi:uncharacterized glyoxalase superfamily protein PhnB